MKPEQKGWALEPKKLSSLKDGENFHLSKRSGAAVYTVDKVSRKKEGLVVYTSESSHRTFASGIGAGKSITVYQWIYVGKKRRC